MTLEEKTVKVQENVWVKLTQLHKHSGTEQATLAVHSHSEECEFRNPQKFSSNFLISFTSIYRQIVNLTTTYLLHSYTFIIHVIQQNVPRHQEIVLEIIEIQTSIPVVGIAEF